MRWAGHVARMGEERGVYRVLLGKPEGRRPLGRPRRRWVDNIRMDLQEVGCGYMDWIGLAQERDGWRTLVSAVMNLRVPWNAGNFLTSCKPVSFSRRTLHHGVSNGVIIFVYCIWVVTRWQWLYYMYTKYEIDKLYWSVCIYLTQQYDGRDMYRIYYIKNKYRFRPLIMAIFRLREWNNLVNIYTWLVWAVYSGEVRGGVGTRCRMRYVGYEIGY